MVPKHSNLKQFVLTHSKFWFLCLLSAIERSHERTLHCYLSYHRNDLSKVRRLKGSSYFTGRRFRIRCHRRALGMSSIFSATMQSSRRPRRLPRVSMALAVKRFLLKQAAMTLTRRSLRQQCANSYCTVSVIASGWPFIETVTSLVRPSGNLAAIWYFPGSKTLKNFPALFV